MVACGALLVAANAAPMLYDRGADGDELLLVVRIVGVAAGVVVQASASPRCGSSARRARRRGLPAKSERRAGVTGREACSMIGRRPGGTAIVLPCPFKLRGAVALPGG